MLQPKDTDWLNGHKNKTHIYAVYKKPTSDLKTHIDWKWGWKNIFHANGKQKKVAILISDKINLKIKIIRDKEGHCVMIKGSIQEEDLTIILCTQHRSTSIHKTNTNRHKRRNWQEHNNSRRLQHLTHTNGQIIKTEN